MRHLSIVAILGLLAACGDRLPTDTSTGAGDTGVTNTDTGVTNTDTSNQNTDTSNQNTDTSNQNTDTGPSDTSSSAVAVTIKQLQTDTVNSPATVTISGVVVTGINQNSTNGYAFYVQDPTASDNAGIQIWANMNSPVTIGDVLDITGTYEEKYDAARIGQMPIVTKTGTADLPAPVVVTASDLASAATAEKYESMLVRVEAALTVGNMLPDAPDDFGDFVVGDGAGDFRIASHFFDVHGAFATLSTGDTFTAVQGVLTYSWSNYKLLPGAETDLEGYVDN